MRRCITSGGAIVVALLSAIPALAEDCAPPVIGAAQVAAVEDGRTLRLSDGREVRIVGLEIPPEQNIASKAVLAQMMASAPAELRGGSQTLDRYNRLPAFVFMADGRSVAAEILRAGLAYASARITPSACAAALFSAEAEARAGKRGVWQNPLLAQNSAEILRNKGQYAVVEGQILSVRESGATIYLNFGRYFTRDFSVTITRRNARAFTAAGKAPKQLEGKRIRVRGVIEQRGGPMLEAALPEQIELAN